MRDHYLIHVWGPVFQGTEAQCNEMRDAMVAKGNPAKQFMVISIVEWKALNPDLYRDEPNGNEG